MHRLVLALLVVTGCNGDHKNKPADSPMPSAKKAPVSDLHSKEITTETGLKYIILRAGLDEKPVRGQRVSVHYTGRFTDGRVFDSSVLQNRPPLVVPVGMGRVIKGWDEALLSMGLGEKRRLTIPPHLAYGDKGFGTLIAPNTTLVFEIEMVGLLERPSGQPMQPPTTTAPTKTEASEDSQR